MELERVSGEAHRPKDALERWNQFLGENQTDIDPHTGSQAVDRIASKDGTRSIRFGKHEMQQINTGNFHYHEETWYHGYVLNVVRRMQKR